MTYSLMTGVEVLAIDSAAVVPSDGAVSSGYAVPASITNIQVRIFPVGTFDTLVVVVQTANNDIAAQYGDVYSSSAAAGEIVVVPFYAGNFVRIKVTSSTGASRTGLTVGIVGK